MKGKIEQGNVGNGDGGGGGGGFKFKPTKLRGRKERKEGGLVTMMITMMVVVMLVMVEVVVVVVVVVREESALGVGSFVADNTAQDPQYAPSGLCGTRWDILKEYPLSP
ncbi:hypothetical protein M0804_005820 [Polistes exclamans]|nr:hypothetical protein M0804_005820 [Polistes exclamans]